MHLFICLRRTDVSGCHALFFFSHVVTDNVDISAVPELVPFAMVNLSVNGLIYLNESRESVFVGTYIM